MKNPTKEGRVRARRDRALPNMVALLSSALPKGRKPPRRDKLLKHSAEQAVTQTTNYQQ
jgi:hypothetical protein